MKMTNLRVRRMCRVVGVERYRKFKVFQFAYEVGTVGDGRGHSNCITFAVRPKLLWFEKSYCRFMLCVLGFEVNHERAYGGIFP